MSASNKILQAAAGNAAGEAVYVDDVFSTYLYEGTNTSTAHQIQNGIDLDGEGGLVWIKKRDSNIANTNHHLVDTERGDYYLASNSTNAQAAGSDINTFNSDGWTFDASTGLGTDYLGSDYVSWTFRKQAGFFDVVTYTGNGSSTRTLSHDLDANIGAVIIKGLNESEGWVVAHRSTSAGNKILQLNTTSGETTANHTYISGSTLTVGTAGNPSFSTNDSGINYVAYLFAHDDQSFGDGSNESIIKCGSYTGDGGTTTPNEITLGFEPQWIMVKDTLTGAWMIADIMRGSTLQSDGSALFNELVANASDAENVGNYGPAPRPNGFAVSGAGAPNTSGRTFIYIAIRRPMKTPEAGTEVFKAISQAAGSSTSTEYDFGITGDLFFGIGESGSGASTVGKRVIDRLRGLGKAGSNAQQLKTTGTDAESGRSDFVQSGNQDAIQLDGSLFTTSFLTNVLFYAFKRATGFFDAVAYTGDGTSSGRNINHNLKAVPELMIVKCRSASDAWMVYSSAIGNTKYLTLNSTAAEATSSLRWNNTTPTDSVFTVGGSGTVNSNGETYISYLFATVAGVSKVGSYTGDGTSDGSHIIDCGFSAGARFVMIKRTDSTGDWWVFDTARGIVAGGDSRLALNLTDAAYSGIDDIDPHSSGFIVTNPGGSDLNVNNATYIFLAIA